LIAGVKEAVSSQAAARTDQGEERRLDETVSQTKAPTRSENVPWKKLRGWWRPAAMVAVIGAIVALWSASSSSKQASIANDQYALEAGAIFKSEILPIYKSREATERRQTEDYTAFDYRIQNIGRHPATNVRIRCGNKNDHGLTADLGTIAAGSSYDIHSHLLHQSIDVLHTNDLECLRVIYLIFDDAVGHHIISFDSAGNAKAEPSRSE
jgi:hypothetical protein